MKNSRFSDSQLRLGGQGKTVGLRDETPSGEPLTRHQHVDLSVTVDLRLEDSPGPWAEPATFDERGARALRRIR